MRPKSSTRKSLLRRIGLGEQLEAREMLSGHSLSPAFSAALAHFNAQAAQVSSITHASTLTAAASHLSDASKTVLTTPLTDSSGTAVGTATYWTGTVNGTTETELKVSISGATASTTFDVAIGGVVVGQITTDSTGAGKLVLSSNPDSSNEQSLPADFPTSVTAGTAVTVGTLSGSLATPTNTGGGCGAFDGTRLSAQLTDSVGSATGTTSYTTSTVDGTTTTKFKVSVTGATASTTYDVAIDGTVVGQLTTDTSGAGSLVLSSNPTGNEQALPANFPTTIAAGSTVTVGTLSGTLATSTASSSAHGFRSHFGRRH
jgi:hypothetical protein